MGPDPVQRFLDNQWRSAAHHDFNGFQTQDDIHSATGEGHPGQAAVVYDGTRVATLSGTLLEALPGDDVALNGATGLFDDLTAAELDGTFADVAARHGMAFAVPHFRGCSGELNLAPRAYHSGDHEEIGWILARLRAGHVGPLLAAGVSLGGNALLRWAGEAGAAAAERVAAVAAVCSPLDLAAGGQAIGRGFNRLVYTGMFLRSMKPKALGKLAQHPGLFDREALLAARDLYEFDNIFTAPLHGFRDTDDYYARASAKPHLHRIRIPALALNARNDPFVPAESLPAASGTWSRIRSTWSRNDIVPRMPVPTSASITRVAPITRGIRRRSSHATARGRFAGSPASRAYSFISS